MAGREEVLDGLRKFADAERDLYAKDFVPKAAREMDREELIALVERRGGLLTRIGNFILEERKK